MLKKILSLLVVVMMTMTFTLDVVAEEYLDGTLLVPAVAGLFEGKSKVTMYVMGTNTDADGMNGSYDFEALYSIEVPTGDWETGVIATQSDYVVTQIAFFNDVENGNAEIGYTINICDPILKNNLVVSLTCHDLEEEPKSVSLSRDDLYRGAFRTDEYIFICSSDARIVPIVGFENQEDYIEFISQWDENAPVASDLLGQEMRLDDPTGAHTGYITLTAEPIMDWLENHPVIEAELVE